jgi:TM2 domain-containing membrane protein YozV/DNA-directed RNA polymerase subunit RPC12/RpoP
MLLQKKQEFDMKIACPYCRLHLDVDPNQGGKEMNCPSCDGRFQVPLPLAEPMTALGQQRSSSGESENPYAKYDGVAASGNQAGWTTQQQAIKDFANKKIAAGICGILLGALGIHKFVLGFNSAGAIMLSAYLLCLFGTCLIFVPLVGVFAIQVIGIVEGVLYLTKSDEEFYQAYAIERREWF